MGPISGHLSPISSSSNTPLTEKQDIIKRWAEHFSTDLNQDSSFDTEVIDSLPRRPFVLVLSTKPSTIEVRRVIKKFLNGKTSGVDGIPDEIFRCRTNLLTHKLCKIFNLVWERGKVPQLYKDDLFVRLYKHKGNSCECDSRVISLLSVTGKNQHYRKPNTVFDLVEEPWV